MVLFSLQVNAQTWSLNYNTATTSEQIVAMSAPNDDICWFLTNFDKLYKTDNGGNNWEIVPPTATSFNPSGLYVMNENVAFKSSNQQLFRTTNGGLNWSLVFTGSQFSSPVVQMQDELTGVVTSGGILYKTSNGGASWSSSGITQPPLSIQNTSGKGSLYCLGYELWATQQNGGITYSPDFGDTWSTPSNFGFTSTSANARVAFSDTNFGIAIKGGVWPYVYVTTDGGNNWTNTENSLGANEDVVADGNQLWYIPNPADHFYIKNSTNAGNSWQIQLQLSGVHGFNVLEKSRVGHRLWAGTNQGKLYRYLPLLSVDEVAKPEIKIYPNPASDKVYFDTSDVKSITLYNILGVKVVSKEIYKIDDAFLNVSNLRNGIYIAKITSNKEQLESFKIAIEH
jgi:photosystem II stability/assembly factor-like uncharacterized protein